MVSVVASPCDPRAGFTRTMRNVKCKQYDGRGANLQHRMSACSGWFSLLLCRAFKLLCVHATKVCKNYPVFWINRPSLSLRCFQEPFSHDFVDLWNAQPVTVCQWPHSKANRFGKPCFHPRKQIAIALWALANQESCRQISDRFDVTMSSVTRCLRRVTKALVDVRGDFIQCPRGRKLFLLTIDLNTERSYITRLRCSACQSEIPTDDQCSNLISLFTQV